jgi:SanA protein
MRVRTLLRDIAILALFIAVACIAVPLGMRVETLHSTYSSIDKVPVSDIAIILGASVINHKPSPVLAARADAAIALWHAGKVQKILVTGDSAQWSHDEVGPVRTYLMNAGIPQSQIFLDHSGFDTYSSIYRARAAFPSQSAVIVTQDFHLPRALFIAQSLGMKASGLDAAQGAADSYDYLREIPASDKALYDLVIRRQPDLSGLGTIEQATTSTAH